ncbi:MAG: Tim44/TimA family putative adaptor protein [Alphaproteobacteria bacterium]|nr:Tim44/TimA family putative adaptor protein [Alphaproteobacteria bacterium]
MEDILQYIDVILLGILLVFLFFIFRRLLGKKVGYEKPEATATISYPDVKAAGSSQNPNVDTEERYKYPVGSLMQKFEIIAENDSSFVAKNFIESSKKAFEMIVRSYAAGSLDSIRDFVSNKVFDSFLNGVNNRSAQGKTLYVDIKQFLLAEIIDVKIDENYDTQISVKYITMQTRELLEGLQAPSLNLKPSEVSEVWVFEKNIKENTSIWKLVQTSK